MKMNFTQSKNGYDTQEVDAVIAELQKQIEDLKWQNHSLSDTIKQYDAKFLQLVENSKRLEEERIKESLRVTGFLNQAAQIAEQTEQDAAQKAKKTIEAARSDAAKFLENVHKEAISIIEDAKRDAEKIRGQAQADFFAVHAALTKLNELTQAMRQSHERYAVESDVHLADIEGFLSKAIDNVSVEPTSYEAPAAVEVADWPAVFQSLPPELAPSDADEPTTAASPENSDPYEEFVKTMNLTGQHPKYI